MTFWHTSPATACPKPTIADGTVAPEDATVAFGATYAVTCGTGFTVNGGATMTCQDGNTFDVTPTCESRCHVLSRTFTEQFKSVLKSDNIAVVVGPRSQAIILHDPSNNVCEAGDRQRHNHAC